MKYRVPYRADAWRRLSPRPEVAGEWQIVCQELDDGSRLYVELGRVPGAPIRVAAARLESPKRVRAGRAFGRQIILTPEQLELVEVVDAQDR